MVGFERKSIFRSGGGSYLVLLVAMGAALVALSAPPAQAAEYTLLGIRIYTPAKVLLKKLGNPTEVLTGGQTYVAPPPGASPGGMLGGGRGGIAPLPRVPMGGMPGSLPGEFTPSGEPGGGEPGGASPAASLAAGPGMAMSAAGGGANGEITYVYAKPNGVTYQFLLSPNGNVIQISVSGYKDNARTSRGVVLGSSYHELLDEYGFPESQQVQNHVVFVSYARRDHVAFQLLDNKVVSIIIAAMV